MALSDKEKESFPSRGSDNVQPNEKHHNKCVKRLEYSMRRNAYVKFMLEAMEKVGCPVDINKHLVCEPCGNKVLGGFDHRTNQVVLCENMIYSQGCMDDVLTHELIHAFDHCRAHVDWNNLDHLACSEIRAANLSGDCFFAKENFGRFRFGWSKHQQDCVKYRAMRSIMCVKDVSDKEATEAVERVFSACFNDTKPFERIPP